MPDLLAGTEVRGQDFPPTQSSEQDTSGTTTSLTYTPTLTGGTTCSCVFTAPTSGRVEIVNTGQLANSGANNQFQTIEVREGAVVGSGTVVVAAADAEALIVTGTAPFRMSCTKILTGLTPGATYNVRQLFRVSAASTGTFVRKRLSVQPLP